MQRAGLEAQVLPDGFQCELSPSYHMLCVSQARPIIERGRRAGLSDPRFDALGEMADRMVRSAARLVLSTGLCAEPQDSNPVSLRALERLLPDLTPPTGHSELPHAGYAVLRHDDSSVFFDAGPYGSAHQHQDKLNVLWTRGPQVILLEHGTQTYENTPFRRLCLGSGGHNVLLVDGTGQWRTGEPVPFPAVDFGRREGATSVSVVGDYGGPYGETLRSYRLDEGDGCRHRPAGPGEEIHGVRHRRAVHLLTAGPLAGALLVEDRVEADRDRRLDLLWHVNATGGTADASGFTAPVGDGVLQVCFASTQSLHVGQACGREGADVATYLDGAPAGWTNYLAHDPAGGRPQPCVRLEVGTVGRRLHCVALFHHAARPAAGLSVSLHGGEVHIAGPGGPMVVASRRSL